MYCHSCGTKAVEDAAYCASCGKKLAVQNEVEETTVEQTEIEEQAQVEQSDRQEEENDQSRSGNLQSRKKGLVSSVLAWGIPLFSLLAVGGGSYYYYTYEKGINETVLELKEKAEAKVLDGHYDEATKLLNKAVSLRPEYDILKENLDVIKVASSYSDSLTKIDDLIKQQKYDEVSKEINSLREKVKKEEDPLFKPFLDKITEKQTTLTIAKVKTEIKDLNTLDELAAKLSMVLDLKTKEASGIEEEIREKIVKVSMEKAEEHLKIKDFSNALASVDEALEYSENNKKLLSFKESIASQQSAFEQAEQQRIEEAMEAAAQEDLKNRTAAVEVVYLDAVVDEYGDLNVSGEIRNTASRPISSVVITFTIYDLEGNYVGEDTTTVFPYYLEPNETGTFEEVYYGIYRDVNVTVNNANWYLN